MGHMTDKSLYVEIMKTSGMMENLLVLVKNKLEFSLLIWVVENLVKNKSKKKKKRFGNF